MAGTSSVASESMKQEARRPRPPLPRPGSFFLLDEHIQIQAELAHGLLGFVVDAQIDEVVGQVGPGEELGREVADHAHILGLVVLHRRDPALHEAIAHGVRQGHVEIVDRGPFQRPALHKEEVVEEGVGQRLGSHGGLLVFQSPFWAEEQLQTPCHRRALMPVALTPP
jgi:hypothetical protein